MYLTLRLIQSVRVISERPETICVVRSVSARLRSLLNTRDVRGTEENRQGERGLRGVAALVGTRLGVGSFVSWTLLLPRINLLPPPLVPLLRPPRDSPFLGHPPFARGKGVWGSHPVLAAATAASCCETPETGACGLC